MAEHDLLSKDKSGIEALLKDTSKFSQLNPNTPNKVGKYGSPQTFDVKGSIVTGKGGHINPWHGGTEAGTAGALPKHPASHTAKMQETMKGKIGVMRTFHQINKLK
jgi:hypothetical protein|tara:strand:- start:955 stop:1272 length:318 start_codon:yes stop_codon:yes gene_type:complete